MFPLAPLPGSTSENTGQTSPPLPAYPVDATGTESCPCPKRSTFDTLNLTGNIKGTDQPYTPGVRSWLKLKHRETVEVVCGAVIGPITRPSEIVAGLVLDGELRIVGRSSPLKGAEARELARWLQPARGHHPWPATVKGTTLDRFNRDKEPVALTLVEPVVVEVSADTAWSGRSFRHALRLLRARPELSPGEVVLPERLTTRPDLRS